MFLSRLFFALICALPVTPAMAHEFWIAPHHYQIDSSGTLQADFKNGEEFEGITLSFFDRSSAFYVMAAGGREIPIAPRSGDSPALSLPTPVENGLVVVAHETTPATLTYRKWEKFLKFADHKDFPNAAKDHIAAGWSKERFKESYTRHVKTLFAVGDGHGADYALGMETEFIALTNPYDPNFNQEMNVSLILEDAPRPDAQVEVFDRAPDGTVTVSLHRTGRDGTAKIRVIPGHEYLFDAVVLRPFPKAGETPDTPVWETLWAGLTFKVPN